MILLPRFRLNVRLRLAELGWNQARLAERMGVPASYLSQYLSPNRNVSPGLGVIQRFADALELDPYFLLTQPKVIT